MPIALSEKELVREVATRVMKWYKMSRSVSSKYVRHAFAACGGMKAQIEIVEAYAVMMIGKLGVHLPVCAHSICQPVSPYRCKPRFSPSSGSPRHHMTKV